MCMHMQRSSSRTGDLGSAWPQVAAFVSAVDAGLGKWLMDAHRIGLTEYRALAHLAEAPERELRVNDLAQRLGLEQSSVTRLVSRLEAKGLARRDVCPDDGRGVYAVITAEGEALVRELHDPFAERLDELLSQPGAHVAHLDAASVARALRAVTGRVAR